MYQTIITIAIVYADPFAREGMINILNRHRDIKVIHEAYNGEDLTRLLDMHTLQPDIVVLDADIHLIQTYATLIKISQKYPAIKAIVLSSHENEYSILKMIEGGAMAYLIKSNNAACELISAIREVASNKYHYGQIDKTLFEKAKNNQALEVTDKEIRFLTLCCEGLHTKEIAKKMCVSHRTVEYYGTILCDKFRVNNRIQLVAFALKSGIVPIT